MNIMKQQANIMLPETPMKHIEKIGRICYKSEDKISDGTDRKFVKMLQANNHHAMLEHYRFIMQISPSIYEALSQLSIRHFEFSSYNNRLLISFNARALMEFPETSRGMMFGYLGLAQKGIRDELLGHILRQYDCHELFGINRDDPPIMLSAGANFIENSPSAMTPAEWKIHGWMSAHFITDRGISHEIVRHRMSLLILPTCLKTELVMTAPMYEWDHFFNLRMRGTTGTPHPLIKELSTDLYNKMQEVYK